MEEDCSSYQPKQSHLHAEAPSLSPHQPLAAIVDEKNAYLFRQCLKAKNFEDNRRRSCKIASLSVAIPVNDNFISNFLHQTSGDGSYMFGGFSFTLKNIDLPLKTLSGSANSVVCLVKNLSCVKHPKFRWNEALVEDLPNSWERHGDLILLPQQCFRMKEWENLGMELWKVVASSFRCSRIARRGRITDNSFRSPAITMLLGSDGWVEHVDNKIRYRYDVTKCMFSAGNVTEKIRVGRFNCDGETVVDLFAGIGYFTLPFLVHARASLVYACEWNPDAVEALKVNLTLNGVADRCIVLEGDNRQTCPKGIADRVNLGLIPSSEGSWDTACAALKRQIGGILHVHGNVTSRAPETKQATASATQSNTFHQTSTHRVTNPSIIGSTPPVGDKELSDTSCCTLLEPPDGTSLNVGDESNRCNAFCDNSVTMQQEQFNETCHIASKEHNNTTFHVSQLLHTCCTVSEVSCDILSSKLVHDRTNTEDHVKTMHRMMGSPLPADTAVNHNPPTNQRFSADGQKLPANQSFSADGQKLPTNQSFSADGQKLPTNQSFSADGQKLPANQSFSADDQNIQKRGEQKHFKRMKTEWAEWASDVCQKLEEILHLQTSRQWQTTTIHIEHIKSYAPHIDHIVADIICTPHKNEMPEENEAVS